MKSHLKSALLGSLLCLGLQTGAQAIAIQTTTYQFSGNCLDCAAMYDDGSTYPVVAELTLVNYTPGNALTNNNFGNFTYAGSNLLNPFSVTLGGDDGDSSTTDYVFQSIFGNLQDLPGFNDVYLTFSTGFLTTFSFSSVQPESELIAIVPTGYFSSNTDGNWNLCTGGLECSNDYGNNGIYSGESGNVPLPGGFALLMAGIGALGLSRRKSAKS